MIGEFRESDGGGLTIEEMYDMAYNNGYSGAWAWSVTDGPWDNIKQGVAYVADYNNQTLGGLVSFLV